MTRSSASLRVRVTIYPAPYRGQKPASANWLSTSLRADHITSASERPSEYILRRFERRRQASYDVRFSSPAKAEASLRRSALGIVRTSDFAIGTSATVL